MKKLLGVLFLSMILAKSAFAGTTIPWTKEGCQSVKGTWITARSATDSGCDAAHCNGMNFCRGPVAMNWFSAMIWCQSIGHKVASWANACPGMPTGSAPCANLNGVGSGYGWTGTSTNEQQALTIELSNGGVLGYNRNYSSFNQRFTPPLCEE